MWACVACVGIMWLSFTWMYILDADGAEFSGKAGIVEKSALIPLLKLSLHAGLLCFFVEMAFFVISILHEYIGTCYSLARTFEIPVN